MYCPCTGRIKLEEYNEILAQAVDFIKGGSEKSIKNLQTMMEEAAEALDFEKAARLRIGSEPKISSIKSGLSKVSEQDVVCPEWPAGLRSGLIFRGSKLVDKERLSVRARWRVWKGARSEFLMRFYERHEIPPQIGLMRPAMTRNSLKRTCRKKGRQKGAHPCASAGENSMIW